MVIATDSMELRLVLHNGHMVVVNATPSLTYSRFRTFSFNKLKEYSALISEAYQGNHAATEVNQGEEVGPQVATVLKAAGRMDLHFVQTMANPLWRRMFLWELKFETAYCPALDEPFRELLRMIEKLDDTLEGTESHPVQLTLPKIDGITVNVSILKLARLYWAAKHLRLQAPLHWDDELRVALIQAINNIDTINPPNQEPAFRAVDFWFIWGAFRNLDDDLVEAMVAKLADAKAHKTDPKTLDVLNMEVQELKIWIEKVEQKKPKMTWAQQFGGGMSGRRANTPSPLTLAASNGATSKAPKSAIYIPPVGRNAIKPIADPPKTAAAAPLTILRRGSEATEQDPHTELEDKKGKGEAYTAPTGMAPPTSAKGNTSGNKKKGNSFGSRRGKGSWRGPPQK